jgi:isocitrate dehydrogenase
MVDRATNAPHSGNTLLLNDESAPAQRGDSGSPPVPVAVAHGDGIGPEIMEATLRILQAARAPLRYDVVRIGESAYRGGAVTGIPAEAWDTIRTHRVLLKAPITTPQGGGYKSLNVTLRAALNLYANVRPAVSYAPFVASHHPGMNVTIIRENEEDVYTGIEHRSTREVFQVLKLVTRPGCERIVRYAFEYARAYGRRRVTCMTKDNIMKLTDGLFHKVFEEIAVEYPDLESDHKIVDIGAARLAAQPERLDVVVTLNLYGDILSDIAAQIAGSVGLAGSANIGPGFAMFEAVHGSAPDIAGKDVANPSGLIVAAAAMLVHVGAAQTAETIKNAWLKTLEDGVHTADIHREGLSRTEVGTAGFADAVIARLGEQPRYLAAEHYRPGGIHVNPAPTLPSVKRLVGVDVFLDGFATTRDAASLAERLQAIASAALPLQLITNRGVQVWPGGISETFLTDQWRCRFAPEGGEVSFAAVLELLRRIDGAGLEVVKTDHLYTYDGVRGFSAGGGE